MGINTDGFGTVYKNAEGVTGSVGGPGSATNNAVVRWDGTDGKLLQDSAVSIDDTGLLTDALGPLSDAVNTIFDTGYESEVVIVTLTGGLNVHVAANTGFIRGSDSYQAVDWDAASLVLDTNTTSYVIVGLGGNPQASVVSPDLTTTILLAVAVTDATDVVAFAGTHVQLSRSNSRAYTFAAEILGPLAVDGLLATANNLQFDVDSGHYWIHNVRMTSAGTPMAGSRSPRVGTNRQPTSTRNWNRC